MNDELHRLKPEQEEQIRQLLLQQKEEILRNASQSFNDSLMGRDMDVGDNADMATQEEFIAIEYRLRDRELKLLKKVEKALRRLEAGEINVCEDCEGPIGFKRLLRRPVTTLCVACKELREREERVMVDTSHDFTSGLYRGLEASDSGED